MTATSGANTTVYQKQIQNSPISQNGLIHYWPINDDLRDYVGSADLVPGNLSSNESIGFGPNRFNATNSSICMRPGYYALPPGVYFNGSFTVLAWIEEFVALSQSRLIDCAAGQGNDEVIIALSYNDELGQPGAQIEISNSNWQNNALTNTILQLNTWYHFAVVSDSQYLLFYINGVLKANVTSSSPRGVNRTTCYIGRSNWYPLDSDANACFDEIKIFNRALSSDEIKNGMNSS